MTDSTKTETSKAKRTTKPAASTAKAAEPVKKVAAVAKAPAKPAAKAAAPAKPSTAKKAPAKATGVNADLRQKMLVDTAYYISQQRHNPQGELNDWLFAEALVDGLIAELGK